MRYFKCYQNVESITYITDTKEGDNGIPYFERHNGMEAQLIITAKGGKYTYLYGSYDEGRKHLKAIGYTHTDSTHMNNNNSKAFFNKILKCWVINNEKVS